MHPCLVVVRVRDVKASQVRDRRTLSQRSGFSLTELVTNRSHMRRHLSPSMLVLTIALLFGLTAWGGIGLTRFSGRIATIWLSNGILVSALLMQSRQSFAWPALI